MTYSFGKIVGGMAGVHLSLVILPTFSCLAVIRFNCSEGVLFSSGGDFFGCLLHSPLSEPDSLTKSTAVLPESTDLGAARAPAWLCSLAVQGLQINSSPSHMVLCCQSRGTERLCSALWYRHSQSGIYSSKKWMTVNTAGSSSIRKAV